MTHIKHSKFKNTGLLFELLVRQVASDVMNGTESTALNLIKRHFKSGSELSKELKLYRSLSEEKFSTEKKADMFIDACISSRNRLQESILRREKYNLIKDLKKSFVTESFLKSRVKNYKLQASIYKLFESTDFEDPKSVVSNRYAIIDNILSTKPTTKKKLVKEDKDVRLLASKIMIDKFNKKYSNLSKNQQKMLREYINNVTNTVTLKEYITTESHKLINEMTRLKTIVPNKILRIKLNEVTNLLKELSERHSVKDKDVLTMLRYYELVKELKTIKG
jgi:hypothetical protein|tara:strand:+ start:2064 stop:2897 length:834 start_codon:yes stop_codon:yes gene_type:complete